MIDWPDPLVKAIARRRAVIVIGSGVSRHSTGDGGVRPPTWKGFLEKAIADCPIKQNLKVIKDCVKQGDYLHACEWLKKRYDEEWAPYLRKIFSEPAFSPAPIHEQLLKLDPRVLFSLNFDDIYERHAGSIHRGSHIVKSYYDADVAEFLRGSGRYIVKLHGNLNSPDKLIFTQKDYSRARIRYSSFYDAFDACLLTHTFIFIGSGYADPDVNLLLENQRFGFPSQLPHYFLTGGKMEVDRKTSLRDNRNLKVIEYDPVDDFHVGLVQNLETLNALVEAEMFEIAKRTSW